MAKPRISYMGYIKQWRVIGADGLAFGRTVQEAWERYQVNPQHLFGLAALVSHKEPRIADTPAKVEAVNALGLAAPIRLGDQTPYWPIDKGYAKHA
jgi:hypothetical protein